MSEQAIEQRLEPFHTDSFGWAMACCDRDREWAEDVLQSAYLKVLEGRARFDGHSKPKTWFFGVIRRTSLEQRRNRIVRGTALRSWFQARAQPPPSTNPESSAGETEEQHRLHRLLTELSRRQRELLHLVFYQELTIEQASIVLGIGIGSARTHYERGKQRLRCLLADQENDDELTQQRRPGDARTVHAEP